MVFFHFSLTLDGLNTSYFEYRHDTVIDETLLIIKAVGKTITVMIDPENSRCLSVY